MLFSSVFQQRSTKPLAYIPLYVSLLYLIIVPIFDWVVSSLIKQTTKALTLIWLGRLLELKKQLLLGGSSQLVSGQ